MAAAPRKCAFVTDVEGNLDYFERYISISKVLEWTDESKSKIRFKKGQDDSHFVYGGDSQDKGIGDIRFVVLLLQLKAEYPERVHFIIGNRDCNKLRLAAELSDDAIADQAVQEDEDFPYWVEPSKRVTPSMFLKNLKGKEKEENHSPQGEENHNKVNRLCWMLKDTMGADGAFQRRKRELEIMRDGGDVSDDDVVQSFVNEVDPHLTAADSREGGNFMLQYLEQGKLAHTFGKTLFVHGGVSEKNKGTVPDSDPVENVQQWVKKLNEWKDREVEAFKSNPTEGMNTRARAGHGLMDYGVPNGNDGKTVICCSNLHDGNPKPMAPTVVDFLAKGGFTTVLAGHIPHGDCPTPVRTKMAKADVTLVTADTSYSAFKHSSEDRWKLEGPAGIDNRGELCVSEVIVDEDGRVEVHGVRADGAEIAYKLPTEAHGEESLVGEPLRDGWWVKAKFKPDATTESAGGDESAGKYLACLGKGQACEYRTMDEQAVRAEMSFAPPKKEDFGYLEWETRADEAPHPFLRVKVDPTTNKPLVEPNVLRFVLEHVWGLDRPNVLLTVTGGAQDFDLDAEDKDDILQGLTDTAKSVNAWFTTGGTSAGIMKYMGLARMLYANDIPLIGIATLGIVKGKEAIVSRETEVEGWKKPVEYEKVCKTSNGMVAMDVNHSHFLFADSGVEKFGQEFHLRSQLEAAICDREPQSHEIMLQAKNLWRDLGVREKSLKRTRVTQQIPAVCICVQGGPGTIGTVTSSVESGTPVLLVKGSGKAADFIADVHTMNAIIAAGSEAQGPQNEKLQNELLRKALGFSNSTMNEEMALEEEDFDQIFKFYGMGTMRKEAMKKSLKEVVQLVKDKPKGFAVYDLNATQGAKGDLKAGLLQCILDWEDYKLKNEDVERIRSKTVLAVAWDKPNILGNMLSTEKKHMRKKGNIKPYLSVVEDGLLEALCAGREQCVEKLIDHGADVTEFGVERQYFRQLHANQSEKLARCRQALQWKILMKSCEDSQKTQHVMVMLDQLKDDFNDRPSSGTTIVRGPDLKAGEGLVTYTYRDLREIAGQSKPNWRATLYGELEKKTDAELDTLFFSAIDTVSRMDELYRRLMGEGWCFSAGALGKTWDLFLCMVLMNRHAIAKICWKKIDSPVRAALVACKMYREMAKKPFVREEVQREMEENATEFEQMATDVMLLAMEENMVLAVESLETRVAFLGGNTVFDLAVDCKARIFVTKCCPQATDLRFYGDLSTTSPEWLPWYVPFPAWLTIFFCVLTAGIPAPFLLEFKLPPDAESSRAPSQRRKIPQGYPYEPNKNKTLQKILKGEDFGGQLRKWLKARKDQVAGWIAPLIKLDSDKKSDERRRLDVWGKLNKDGDRIKNFSEEQIAEVWMPTFTIWERWLCFVQAPIVHFQARAVIYTSLVVYFTYCITEVQIKVKPSQDADASLFEAVEAENRKQMQSLQDGMSKVMLYMVGSAFIEMSQMWNSGVAEYISDSWNFIDISTLVMFFFGYYLKTWYLLLGPFAYVFDQCAWRLFDWPSVHDSTEVLDDQKKWYCVCLFFCWLRLLHLYSVNKTLGKLVRAIWLMVKDIGTFIFVWGFFLMAFAAAMSRYAGEVMDDGGKDGTCSSGITGIPCDKPKDPENVTQWKSWWILRTYFQAYGEMDLDGLNDWVSVTIFMVLLLVLQLVLNNTVFVAVLTAKFEGVLEESETDWIFEMYEISEEFMQHPAPSPFNLVWMLWELLQFIKDEPRVQELISEELRLSLLEEADKNNRWWYFHRRLRHPRFHGALIIPQLPAEAEEQKDPAKKGWFVSFLHGCSDLLTSLPHDEALGWMMRNESVRAVVEYLDGANMAVKETEEDGRKRKHRDGEVRRRDRALVMRAKAKYLEKQDDSADRTEEIRAKLTSLESNVKELSETVTGLKASIDATRNTQAAS